MQALFFLPASPSPSVMMPVGSPGVGGSAHYTECRGSHSSASGQHNGRAWREALDRTSLRATQPAKMWRIIRKRAIAESAGRRSRSRRSRIGDRRCRSHLNSSSSNCRDAAIEPRPAAHSIGLDHGRPISLPVDACRPWSSFVRSAARREGGVATDGQFSPAWSRHRSSNSSLGSRRAHPRGMNAAMPCAISRRGPDSTARSANPAASCAAARRRWRAARRAPASRRGRR